jgi:hypothetical protein
MSLPSDERYDYLSRAVVVDLFELANVACANSQVGVAIE